MARKPGSSIVTYEHRYKRPKKKPQAAKIEGPAVIKVTDRKQLKAIREERALEAGSEPSAELKAFLKRMMRPPPSQRTPNR
jgi:hypothetical protein